MTWGLFSRVISCSRGPRISTNTSRRKVRQISLVCASTLAILHMPGSRLSPICHIQAPTVIAYRLLFCPVLPHVEGRMYDVTNLGDHSSMMRPQDPCVGLQPSKDYVPYMGACKCFLLFYATALARNYVSYMGACECLLLFCANSTSGRQLLMLTALVTLQFTTAAASSVHGCALKIKHQPSCRGQVGRQEIDLGSSQRRARSPKKSALKRWLTLRVP